NVNSYTATPDAMGYPRDKPHAWTASPASRVGDGSWDIDAYWRVNHPMGTPSGAVLNGSGVQIYDTSLTNTIMAAAPLPAGVTRTYPTRFQVYEWEMANAATQLTSHAIGSLTSYGQPICRPGLAGSTPGAQVADRRTLPVAVVNCTGLTGHAAVNPLDWINT